MFGKKSARTQASPGGWWETLKTVFYAVLIAFVFRTVAYEPFNIPSGSMKPTLLIGDYLFVAKFAYGYSRHSLPWSLPLISDRLFAREPERGDVAVFKWPVDNSTDYIKRIVGLPGDRIQVRNGVLYINGRAVKRKRIKLENPDRTLRAGLGVAEYRETMPNGVSYRTFDYGPSHGPLPNPDNTRITTVPQGQYFMMGDNRDRSSDSRVWGTVKAENLVGRAELLFFSTNGSARLWEFWRWPASARYNRVFRSVE